MMKEFYLNIIFAPDGLAIQIQIDEFEANALELGTLTQETQKRLVALRAKIDKSEIAEGIVDLNNVPPETDKAVANA